MTTADTLTHRCLRGRHCADHDATPDGRQLGAGVDTPDTLCPTCERHVGRAIADLPRLYTQLEQIIDVRRVAGEPVSGTKEPPAPLRLDILVLQAEVDATLTAWARPVAGRCRITWDVPRVRRLRPGPRVGRAAHVLASNLDALLRLPDVAVDAWTRHGVSTVKVTGVQAALRLLTLHQRGRQLVTGGSGDARLPVPCPQCEAPALTRRNGSGQVSCAACGSSWAEADYRRLCLVLADDHRAELPAGRVRRRVAA